MRRGEKQRSKSAKGAIILKELSNKGRNKFCEKKINKILKMNQMTGKPNHISIITLNVNGLNSSIKRHRLADWIKKKDPTICCLQETHLIERNTHRLKVKGWEKTYHVHGLSKKAGVSILTSDNVNFKPTLVRRDKEGHFILL